MSDLKTKNNEGVTPEATGSHTRNSLYIPDGTVNAAGVIGIRHITHADVGVTAKQIWIASDIRPGSKRGEKWSNYPCTAKTRYLRNHSMQQFIDTLDFIAQTPTASSYGFLQVMFDLAVQHHWSVDDPASPGTRTHSPRYLVDTDEAIALKNGGSLFVGGEEDVEHYKNAFAGSAPTTFATQEAFTTLSKIP